MEIISSSAFSPSRTTFLIGLFSFAIDTPGRVTYLAFSDDATRQDFAANIKIATFRYGSDGLGGMLGGGDDLSDPRETFVLKSGQWAGVAGSTKSNKRVILNARKMRFDNCNVDWASWVKEDDGGDDDDDDDGDDDRTSSKGAAGAVEKSENAKAYTEAAENSGDCPSLSTAKTLDRTRILLGCAAFSEKLLNDALQLTTDSSLEELIKFLDTTACLRSMEIHNLDLNSEAAVCLFVNIYHCLLQHALLLLGPPSRHSISHFMRCVCYEIGNDAFSLAELEHCVIRGNLNPPFAGKFLRCSTLKWSSSVDNRELSRAHSRSPSQNCDLKMRCAGRSFCVEPTKSSIGFHKYALSSVDARINFILQNG